MVWGIYHGLLTMLETALVKEKKPRSNENAAEALIDNLPEKIYLVLALPDMSTRFLPSR